MAVHGVGGCWVGPSVNAAGYFTILLQTNIGGDNQGGRADFMESRPRSPQAAEPGKLSEEPQNSARYFEYRIGIF